MLRVYLHEQQATTSNVKKARIEGMRIEMTTTSAKELCDHTDSPEMLAILPLVTRKPVARRDESVPRVTVSEDIIGEAYQLIVTKAEAEEQATQ